MYKGTFLFLSSAVYLPYGRAELSAASHELSISVDDDKDWLCVSLHDCDGDHS